MIKMRWIGLTCAMMLSCFVAQANLSGQVATATILGMVTDASGAAIPGAKIDVKNTGTGVTQSAISNELGRYIVPDLQIGDYEVQAGLAGFQTLARRGITLTVG